MNKAHDRAVPRPFPSLTSRHGHGHGVDVRATYAGLPVQLFWTWLTGKALDDRQAPASRNKLMSLPQFFGQIAWSWTLILSSIFIGATSDYLVVQALAMVIVTNRTRGLLHTFHYTIHGASIADMRVARFAGKYLLNVPIMHTPWEQYKSLHVKDHHKLTILCTDEDPDQQFMRSHGFHERMSATEFWLKIFLSPFHPMRIWEHIAFRLKTNFVRADNAERIPRIVFWAALLGGAAWFGVLSVVAKFYLLPLFILTQFSSYIQHITEHLWFPPAQGALTRKVYYASLTWGRFFGRPYPQPGTMPAWRRPFALLTWWCSVLLIDLPIRVFSFMQDLSSHDFHHRNQGCNFWHIPYERERSAHVQSDWGPMTETWSVWESILVLRDHLVYGQSDPFGLYKLAEQGELGHPAGRPAAPSFDETEPVAVSGWR